MKKNSAAPMRANPTTPPTVPPAIAPTFVLLLPLSLPPLLFEPPPPTFASVVAAGWVASVAPGLLLKLGRALLVLLTSLALLLLSDSLCVWGWPSLNGLRLRPVWPLNVVWALKGTVLLRLEHNHPVTEEGKSTVLQYGASELVLVSD